MIVHALGHSCFMIEFDDAVLLFDVVHQTPEIPSTKKVYVFASHWHRDHFSFHIFSHFPEACFILSDDIRKKYNRNYFLKHGVSTQQLERIHFIKADCTADIDQLHIKTLASTDSGVAFVVEIKKKTLFHAGDLNNWRWEDDTPDEIHQMTTAFEQEIRKLNNHSIHLAMFPYDPRLRQYAFLGIDAFMNTLSVDYVLPMHLWNHLDFIQTLKDKEWYHKVLNTYEQNTFHLL